jgi:hypothetical protein
MTVTREVADAVHAAERDLSPAMPLVTASGRIATQIGQPQSTVLAVLRGYHLTVQERAS